MTKQLGLQVDIFSTAVLNFNFDIWKINDTERLCQISWKSDLHFVRNYNEYTNERTNQQTRPITVPPGGGKK